MRRVTAAAMIVAATASAIAQRAPLDYPQWRGRQRDGSASAFAEPKVWPDRMTRRWTIDVGSGYATPLLVGDTVYVFTRRDDDEVLTAIDARRGTERWRSTYRAPYIPSQAAAAHGAGPKATPLFLDGKVFTLGISGIVTAFDARTGARVWQTPAPVEPPYFSAASSPAGEHGLVVVHPGNYGPLTAFDAATGSVKWTAGESGFFASPIIVTLHGTRQVVSVTTNAVIGVAVADGTILWHFPWKGGSGGPTPVIDGEMIIVSGLNEPTTAFTTGKQGRTWTTQRRWDTRDASMYISTPVVVGGTLFGLSHRASGQLFAIDTRSGRTLWLGRPREADNIAFVKAGNILFLLNDDAELIVARASRLGFEPIARYSVAETATWAQPLISGDRVFIKDANSLTLWTLSR